MPKSKLIKGTATLAVLTLLIILVARTSAIIPGNSTAWFSTSDTNIASVAVGDVNGDNQTEIVTAGTYNDGFRYNAQLIVWNSSTLTAENIKGWYWVDNTDIASVAARDVNGDNQTEIITGGSYFDGVRPNAQLIVWNGSSLAAEGINSWFTTSNTTINSVAFGDVDASGSVEIVTGGQYFDGVTYNAQLEILNGVSLALKDYYAWISTATTLVNSVAVDNLNTLTVHIITAGQYNDLTRFDAQLRVWG